MNFREVILVLAEDDDGHAELIQRNLLRSGLTNQIHRVRDGMEAWEFLNSGAPNNGFLLLLDLSMPRMDGVTLLKQMKASPVLSMVPVIILSTTDDPREIERCYALGCNVYVTKPVDYDAFMDAVRRLGLFLQIVQTPPSNGQPAGE